MYLNSDIIFERLSKYITVTRSGHCIQELTLHRPVFLQHDMPYEVNRTYICRPGQLPPPINDICCLIIYVGGRLPINWNPRQCCVMVIQHEPDILYVFNILTEIFDFYSDWEQRLRKILDTSASIAEMIQITSVILDNPICLCNNRLEIEAIAGGDGFNELDGVGLVSEKNYHEFSKSHADNITRRKPFLFEINGMSTYNINIYKQETYLGLVTLGAAKHHLTDASRALFEYFFHFVSSAVDNQSNIVSGQFTTIKSIAHDLLSGLPVSDAAISQALEKEALDKNRSWTCAAILPLQETGHISVSYFSLLLESRLLGSFALYIEPHIILYIPTNPDSTHTQLDTLEKILLQLNARAGMSGQFEDIRKFRDYYHQAVSALEVGFSYDSNKTLYPFSDYALAFALRSSTGDLTPECIIPRGLMELVYNSSQEDGVDYWNTLKVYLDNEMNTAETARDLYIHRTTLYSRLERIKQHVVLDTPEQRFYIQYCIYLYELLHHK